MFKQLWLIFSANIYTTLFCSVGSKRIKIYKPLIITYLLMLNLQLFHKNKHFSVKERYICASIHLQYGNVPGTSVLTKPKWRFAPYNLQLNI